MRYRPSIMRYLEKRTSFRGPDSVVVTSLVMAHQYLGQHFHELRLQFNHLLFTQNIDQNHGSHLTIGHSS